MKRISVAARIAGVAGLLSATVLVSAAGAQAQDAGESAGGLQVGLVLAVLAAMVLLVLVVRMLLKMNSARPKPMPEATQEELQDARLAIVKARTRDALCAEVAHQAVAVASATGSVAIIDGFESRSGEPFEVPKELVMNLHRGHEMVVAKKATAAPIMHDGAVVGLVAARGAHANNLNALAVAASEAYEGHQQPSRLEAAAVRAHSSNASNTEVDGLTGIPNRRRFDHDLAQVTKTGTEDGEAAPVSLAMFDIDNFSYFNDAHGKQAGNEVLRSIAEHIASNLRESDVVYRYSGVRFVALLPGADIDNAYMVVDRIRDAVESDSYSGEEVQPLGRVTMSVGIANAVVDGSEDLVEAADGALAKAKAEGRNKVMIEADLK